MTDLQPTLQLLRYSPHKRAQVFRELPVTEQARVLAEVGNHLRYALVGGLKPENLATILAQLDPDVATDVVQVLPKRRQKQVIQALSDRVSHDVSKLLPFDPNTAAGLMTLDYIQVDEDDTIATVASKFKTHESRTGRHPAIVVMHEGGVSGFLPGHELALALPTDTAGAHRHTLTTISQQTEAQEVIELFRQHPHDKLVVLGDTGNVLGVIFSDDVLRLLRDQQAASLYQFAGVRAEEEVNDSVKQKIHSRALWLVINLATAFLASFVVGRFESVLDAFVLLAVYMPIVAGMGGNAATQTLAVLVRGIAMGQIDLSNFWQALRNEVGAALVNGIINGIIVAVVVLVVNRDLAIAIILALAMVINLLVAATFGTVVPLIMKALKKDPAASATIFITTATDVFGFLAFLGLASWILM